MANNAEPEQPRMTAADVRTAPEPARVFVSYASPDVVVAAALVDILERNGIACWIAPRDVAAGAPYSDAIIRAIGGAKALALVLSKRSIRSSHVAKEVERACAKKRPIHALRIDDAPLTAPLEYFLSDSQWVDARDGNLEPAFARLIAALGETGPSSPQPLAPMPPPAALSGVRRPRRRLALAAGLVIALLALAIAFAVRFWLAKHDGAGQPNPATASLLDVAHRLSRI